MHLFPLVNPVFLPLDVPSISPLFGGSAGLGGDRSRMHSTGVSKGGGQRRWGRSLRQLGWVGTWSAAVGSMAPEAAFHIVTGVLVVVFLLLRVIGVIVVLLHLILLIVLRLVGLLGVAVLFFHLLLSWSLCTTLLTALRATVVLARWPPPPPVAPPPPPGGAGAAGEGWGSREGRGPATAASSGCCCPCWASSAASWGPSQPGLRPICRGGYRGAVSEDPRWVQTWAVAAVAGLRSGSRGLLGRPVHLPL
ncbi:PREDICTED: uncharacterized protein LOC108529359 [Rhinopithecus bieti]|uniref:uncharacterized protein LOC108529359 n=1 Tax=Rhinopithecus bieti TaxID=61621 RepID=UPI00083BD654|nr:PREDICTED: uncharacterized protein LOC108529359 [Rhinopithecus bieti]